MPLDVEVKDVSLVDEKISLLHKGSTVTIPIQDVIGFHQKKDNCSPPKILTGAKKTAAANLLYIKRSDDPEIKKWQTDTLNVMGEEGSAESIMKTVHEKKGELDRPKKLLILLNPIGGKQTARSVYSNLAGPLFTLAGIECEVLYSEKAKHMTDLVTAFDTSTVDGIVIMGGDGSVCEVLNALQRKFHGDDVNEIRPFTVPVGVLPAGTGNGFCEGLTGVKDMLTAILHIINGKRKRSNLLGIHSGGRLLSTCCCVVAYGLFGDVMYHTDKQRWLKRLRYAVVPVWVMLFKKQRLFDAKITYNVREQNPDPGTDEEATNNIIKKEVTGSFLYSMSLKWNIYGHDGQVSIKDLGVEKRSFNLVTSKHCGKLVLLQTITEMILQNPNAFNKDFIDVYTLLSYKVEVLSKKSEEEARGSNPDSLQGKQENEDGEVYLEKLIDVDGEIFEIVDNEFEVKLYPDILTVYSSLEDTTTPQQA